MPGEKGSCFMGRNNETNKVVRQWIEYAEEDLRLAKYDAGQVINQTDIWLNS